MTVATQFLADLARTSAPTVLAWAERECQEENHSLALAILAFFGAVVCVLGGLAQPLLRFLAGLLFLMGLASAAHHARRRSLAASPAPLRGQLS